MDPFILKIFSLFLCVYNLEPFKVAFLRVWNTRPSECVSRNRGPSRLPQKVPHQTKAFSLTKGRNVWETHGKMVMKPGGPVRTEGNERMFLNSSTTALPALQVYLLISMDCTLGNTDQVFPSYLTLKYFFSSEKRGSVIRYLDFGLSLSSNSNSVTLSK